MSLLRNGALPFYRAIERREEPAMFDAYCSHCEKRGLYTMRRVLSMRNEPEGFVLTFRCYCGTVGSTTMRRVQRGPDDDRREEG